MAFAPDLPLAHTNGNGIAPVVADKPEVEFALAHVPQLEDISDEEYDRSRITLALDDEPSIGKHRHDQHAVGANGGRVLNVTARGSSVNEAQAKAYAAVDAIDFDVAPGESFGFLGPNGAGKTSTMRMIGCVSPVTDGERVYVYLGYAGLYALDFDGRIVWSKPMDAQPVRQGWGSSASPALHDGRLFVVNDAECVGCNLCALVCPVEGCITLVHKTNVLTYAGDLYQRVVNEVATEYPDVTTDYAHVDATCMWMVKNPEWFDVLVTDNMFGDIITDLGAMIQGGMGIAAGGNINPETVSMFEPIGGSAPKYTGQNVINPLAAVCAGAMMLDYLGENAAAKAIETVLLDMKSGKFARRNDGMDFEEYKKVVGFDKWASVDERFAGA